MMLSDNYYDSNHDYDDYGDDDNDHDDMMHSL